MSPTGAPNLVVAARSALLDAMEALDAHRDALILIGAQAIYLHTGDAPVALAEATKDSDVAVDPRVLADEPLLDAAMKQAGFSPDLENPQPGSYFNSAGVPVDLMVPEALAGGGSRGARSARIPPHPKRSARRAEGLEAAMIDHELMTISALDPADTRSIEMRVAGPSALLVAKLHKLGERQATPNRLNDKDAHDVYRLLVALPTDRFVAGMTDLLGNELAGGPTGQALDYAREMFATGGTELGAEMAGRAEQLVGEPETVRAATLALMDDLLAELR